MQKSGKAMPIEIQVQRRTLQDGEIGITIDGTTERGPTLLELEFHHPHWMNCPKAKGDKS